MKKLKAPVNPFHPGEMLLEEFIEPNGWTQAYLADELGWTKAKRGITADTALDLAEFLGTTAKLWMNLKATFDLDQATKRRLAA